MPAPDEIALFAARLNEVGADYIITGATAAIVYGQPRLTNDLDVVLALTEGHIPALLAAFPENQFYLPPLSVIRVEQARSRRWPLEPEKSTPGVVRRIMMCDN
jgi:hypothetical protein